MVQVGVPDYLQDIKRLKGLRSIGAPIRADEELEEPMETLDISGTAQGSANLPLPDPVDGGIAPISYDVRANEVLKEDKDSQLRKLGAGLAQVVKSQTPDNLYMAKSVDAEMPSQPEAPESKSGFTPYPKEAFSGDSFKAIGDYFRTQFNPQKRKEASAQNETIAKKGRESRAISRGLDPNRPEIQSDLNSKIDEGLKTPPRPMYGATDQVANSPDLKAQFKTITGRDFTPEIQNFISEFEKIAVSMDEGLQGYDQNLSDRENQIKERIESGGATDEDKFLIGMALLMPLIVGGVFGAEAGVSALGGTAGSLADIYKQRKEQGLEDQDTLTNLTKSRADVALKRGELNANKLNAVNEFTANLPKQERDFLIGKKEAVWIDPQTNQEQTGIELAPGLVIRPEFVTSKEELTNANKEARDLASAKGAVETINSLTDDIISIASQLKDKNVLQKGFSSALVNKDPSLRSVISDDVEFQGRKVNAGVTLDSKLKALVDAYRQAKGMRALTGTVQDHIDGMLTNPIGSFNSPKDTIDQMLYVKDLAQTNLINNAESQGFVPQFLQQDFSQKNRRTNDKLNKQQDQKDLVGIKQALNKS